MNKGGDITFFVFLSNLESYNSEKILILSFPLKLRNLIFPFNALSVRMFNVGGKSHNAPSSNIKEKNFKFPKHTELFADDYYDD